MFKLLCEGRVMNEHVGLVTVRQYQVGRGVGGKAVQQPKETESTNGSAEMSKCSNSSERTGRRASVGA